MLGSFDRHLEEASRTRPVSERCHLFVALAVLVGPIVPVSAEEMWIAPTFQRDFGGGSVARSIVWPVTPYGAVRLSFAVPNNLSAFQRATLALIPDPPSGAATLTVHVCTAQNGQVATAACEGPFEFPFVGTANTLVEVDISAAVGAALKVPGQDYVAVHAYTSPTNLTDHIVGMRFVYDASSGSSGQQCPSGQVVVGFALNGSVNCAPLPPVAPWNLVLVSQVSADTPVVIAWDHDGVATSGYKLFVDGVVTDLGAVAPGPTGRYEISHPGFGLGDHVVMVAAYNGSGLTMSLQLRVSAVP